VLSGGLVPGGVLLLGGEKGCGKSTISLVAASRLAARGPVLYAAGEQVGEELKQTASRLMLENIERMRIVPAMGGFEADFGDTMMHYKPIAVFIDSLQTIFDSLTNVGPMIEFVQRLKEYSTALRAPITIISQINSQGQFTGAEAIPHLVDTVASISVDDDTGLRLFLIEKNRYGRAPLSMVLRMRDDGTGLEKAVVASDDE
jgi:DNA repair protein RadA/Sms